MPEALTLPALPPGLWTWAATFTAIAVGVFAALEAVKATAHRLHPGCVDSRLGQAALELAPPVLGAAAGWGAFEGLPLSAGVLLGAAAGANSEWLYRRLRKRAGAWLSTSEARAQREEGP